MTNEEKLAKIKKIRSLALSGVGGEKNNAEKLLKELLEKYEIELSEVDEFDDQVKAYDFWFHGEDEKRILVQVMYKVVNIGTYYELSNPVTGRAKRTRIRKECTLSQKVDIEFLFNFYKSLWYKEKDYLMSAFIHKHQLFGTCTDGVREPKEPSEEDWYKIQAMKRGLYDADPSLNRLTEGESHE